MIRLLILIAAGYGLYRSLRSWTMPDHPGKVDSSARDHIADVMVRDPVCRVYIPQREGIRWQQGARTVYFCSQDCLEKFKQNGFNQPKDNE